MKSRLQQLCDGKHAHQPLESGRAAHAAFYPDGLIAALLRGIRDTFEAEHHVQAALEVQHHQQEHDVQEEGCDQVAGLTTPHQLYKAMQSREAHGNVGKEVLAAMKSAEKLHDVRDSPEKQDAHAERALDKEEDVFKMKDGH